MLQRSLREIAGYGLLLVSCIAWVVLPAIPFLDISGAQKAAWGGGLFVFAEVTWWAAMPLLGPEVMAFIRGFWARLRSSGKNSSADSPEDENSQP
ncbi:transporter suffix domain-containing protein [Halioglobus maricola]|nr:transporter suffix domain-containing protein [Halioglobus maricola]